LGFSCLLNPENFGKMIITRHNYEKFFLMYVDDELTAAERVAVDLFVQQNPDLAAELEMLQQTKLTADDELHFADKKMLLQNVDDIGIDNYEEQFLLYIDKELDEKKRNDVEKFVLQHPQFQDEFTLLKQTVLEPEAIIFEDKNSLFRKEERRVVPMFIRFAAAAAVIGVAAVVWWLQTNKTITPVIANTVDSVKNNTASVPEEKTTHGKNTIEQQASDVAVTITEEKKEQEVAVAKPKVEKKEKEIQPVRQTQINTESNNVVAINNDPKINNAETSGKVDISPNEEAMADVKVQDNNSNTNYARTDVQYNNDNSVRFANNNNTQNNLVQNAVYKELNTEEEDKNLLYVGSLQLNKNKVRGLVKKVGGIFAGRSKDAAKEDGKLQIANLEINTN
jgi:hypothetical protein